MYITPPGIYFCWVGSSVVCSSPRMNVPTLLLATNAPWLIANTSLYLNPNPSLILCIGLFNPPNLTIASSLKESFVHEKCSDLYFIASYIHLKIVDCECVIVNIS